VNDTFLRWDLIAFLILPLLGALGAFFPAPPGLKGRSPEHAVLRHGVSITGVVLLLTIALAAGFDYAHPGRMQATTDLSWISSAGIRFHLGVDGVSLPLLVLTALLTFLSAVYSYVKMPQVPPAARPQPSAWGTSHLSDEALRALPSFSAFSAKGFVALLLVLETGMLATFAVLDLMLFFLAFETVLIPMYFLIARWGSDARDRAALRFILYTVLGSVVMLLGLLLIGLKAGTFDMVALASKASISASGAGGSSLSHTTQVIAVLAIGIGLAVKAPMWPLHSWLPDAHTCAPTVGSVLLAGVLLKMGTYGFVRIILPIAPQGAHTFAPYLAAFAVVGIIYGSLACLAIGRQGSGGDLKRLIAYSSVGHMGFVLLGIATLTPTGVNGALFANVAHGLITGLLFFLVGAIKDRYGTTDLDRFCGTTGAALYGAAPRLGALLAFGAVASLGLPGLAGFWGEMLAMFGSFHPAAGLSRSAYLTFTGLAAFGTLLTAAYLLLVVRRVCMGERRMGAETDRESTTEPASSRALVDVQGYEFASWTPLAVLTLLAGLWPAALLGLTDPAVRTLLGGS
jgi:NADH-quinone oxidoreductase subunit M